MKLRNIFLMWYNRPGPIDIFYGITKVFLIIIILIIIISFLYVLQTDLIIIENL